MGRGEQKTVNNESKSLFGTETANANAVNPAAGYSSLLAHPGYTPAQKTSIANATTGGVGAAFGSAEEGAVNRAGRTGNTAGLTSNEDALARERMVTSGNLAAQNEVGFANAARADRNTALAGQGALYGANLSGANTTLGHQASNAAHPGFWDQMAMGALNAGGQIGAAVVGG